MDQNKEKTSCKHVHVTGRMVSSLWPLSTLIHMKTTHISRTSTKSCYCHYQVHAVHMQSCHNIYSKCRPCTVKLDAALLIPWYWKWSYRGNRATWDTCFYISSLFWSKERVSKIWPPISETSFIYWLPAGLNGPQAPYFRDFFFQHSMSSGDFSQC